MPIYGQCPSSCNFNGDCIDGKCDCFLGFQGHDCNQREFKLKEAALALDSVLEPLICQLFMHMDVC